MKKRWALLLALATEPVLLILLISLISGKISLLEKAFMISAVAAMPEGAFYEMKSDGITNCEKGQSKTGVYVKRVAEEPKTEDTKEESTPVIVPISGEKYGDIIKKTMSPYNASQKYNNVYINNQCGKEVDIAKLLQSELPYTVENSDEPQVLIYHTHTTEAYMTDESDYYTDSDEPRTRDESKNVVAVGEEIAKVLENAGIKVVHDTAVHDDPGFTGSYTRSAETVRSNLSKYPSLKLLIDVHRDSVTSGSNDKIAPTVLVNGEKAAQVMLVMGSETGSVTGYPDWQKNLITAVKLQNLFEEDYPELARSLLLKSAKYNQNLTTGSVLIEMGSDCNTLNEALLSAKIVGEEIVKMLKVG